MSYVERLIDLTITLGATPQNPNPTFQGTASNTVKITGLRTSVAIVKAGGRGLSTAQVRVYGLPLSVMNQLSTLGVPIVYWVGKNTITIEAGGVGPTSLGASTRPTRNDRPNRATSTIT